MSCLQRPGMCWPPPSMALTQPAADRKEGPRLQAVASPPFQAAKHQKQSQDAFFFFYASVICRLLEDSPSLLRDLVLNSTQQYPCALLGYDTAHVGDPSRTLASRTLILFASNCSVRCLSSATHVMVVP